jgi:hypothetical protein
MLQGMLRYPRIAILLAATALAGFCRGDAAMPGLPPTFPTPLYSLDSSFPQPSGVTFNTVSWISRDPKTNLIYVLQRSAPPVSVWTPEGKLVSRWTTKELGDPHSIALQTAADGSRVAWVTDMAPPLLAGHGYGHCLKLFTLSGNLLSTTGTCAKNSQGTGLNPVQFDEVTDIAWDAMGNSLISDGDLNGLNNRLLKLDSSGKVLISWSAPGDEPGSGPLQFNLPHALLVDRCDRVWIADALNHRVQVMDSDGTYRGELTSFGNLGVYALALGASASSQPATVLFVGASPTTGAGTGTVYLFAAPMDCAHPNITNQAPFASFNVPIPSSTSTTLLHSLTVDPQTWDVYLSVLGGNLPPQKWVARWPGAGRPGSP